MVQQTFAREQRRTIKREADKNNFLGDFGQVPVIARTYSGVLCEQVDALKSA